MTIVAVGTSVPELAATISAALRKQGGMAFGNVIGSNIFNIGAILGVTGTVHPLAVPQNIGILDAGAIIAAVALALWLGATGLKVTRLEGATLLGSYVLYITLITIGAIG